MHDGGLFEHHVLYKGPGQQTLAADRGFGFLRPWHSRTRYSVEDSSALQELPTTRPKLGTSPKILEMSPSTGGHQPAGHFPQLPVQQMAQKLDVAFAHVAPRKGFSCDALVRYKGRVLLCVQTRLSHLGHHRDPVDSGVRKWRLVCLKGPVKETVDVQAASPPNGRVQKGAVSPD